MKLTDFDFDLPESLIAQKPSDVRGQDKLMSLERRTGKIAHHKMQELPSLIKSNSLMVFNDSKVRRARVFAKKIIENPPINTKQPQAKDVQFIFTCPVVNDNGLLDGKRWQALMSNAKRQHIHNRYLFGDGTMATLISKGSGEEGGICTLDFDFPISEEWFNHTGHIPLPPYIKREDNSEDTERYQTVYASNIGSVACPTAGLHYTKDILEQLKAKGVEIVFITLHVGLGTFLPVREEIIENHKMHSEVYSIDENAAKAINKAKEEGRKVIAVGTTSMRTLEAAGVTGRVNSGTHATNIFIYPPYNFKIVDALFTNFHTPKSTLLMLVSAFAGKDNILNAYSEAIKNQYKFFSYGDAMLLD